MGSDPDAGKQCMVEIAAARGVTLTSEEVHGFLLQMDEEEDFDDIELDPIALMAIAGGIKERRETAIKYWGIRMLIQAVRLRDERERLQLNRCWELL